MDINPRWFTASFPLFPSLLEVTPWFLLLLLTHWILPY
jgi:hypothetical protein